MEESRSPVFSEPPSRVKGRGKHCRKRENKRERKRKEGTGWNQILGFRRSCFFLRNPNPTHHGFSSSAEVSSVFSLMQGIVFLRSVAATLSCHSYQSHGEREVWRRGRCCHIAPPSTEQPMNLDMELATTETPPLLQQQHSDGVNTQPRNFF